MYNTHFTIFDDINWSSSSTNNVCFVLAGNSG
jgi:hypothetical protein